MKTPRWTGIALLVLAGCAGTAVKKPLALTAHANRPPAQTAQPLPEPDWQQPETPTASEMVTQSAAAYAKQVHATDPASARVDAPPASPALPAESRVSRPVRPTVSQENPNPLISPSATAQALPASAALSPRGKAAEDEPQIVPESADFQSPSPGSGRNDELGNRLHHRLAQNPQDLADQLDLQLFGMLNEDPTAELAAVSALRDDDRELISALIDGLSNFRSTVRQNPNLLAAQKIKPLIEMADRLRSQAGLTVSTVQLCSRVDAYGKYTPISPARFTAGKGSSVIVYCEVENFATKENRRQMWETRLTEQVTIFTDTGMLAWSDNVHPVTDECRNRRHDFFAYNVISLPRHLTLGRYLLKVSIEDKIADRVAELSVPFEMTADEAISPTQDDPAVPVVRQQLQ